MHPIVVHSCAIVALSLPLARLLRPDIEGAQTGTIEFPDLEPEDFERLCEYAYTGTFTSPKSHLVNACEMDIRRDFFLLSPRMAAWCCCSSGLNLQSRKEGLLRRFLALTFGNIVTGWEIARKAAFSPRDCEKLGLGNRDGDGSLYKAHWREDVGGVLLGYARLYVFADRYLIENLKQCALRRLRAYLVELDIFPVTRSGVTELVRYAYDNQCTHASVARGKMVPLRSMVVEFVALHLHVFNSFAEHEQLLREEGEYAVDLHDTIVQWLL
ncbi:hypothetical protein TW65_05815 [Stemphylium lycopersici]|nr:hypothetical protein TW65_05815 [Stemphylium lycopersici]